MITNADTGIIAMNADLSNLFTNCRVVDHEVKELVVSFAPLTICEDWQDNTPENEGLA